MSLKKILLTLSLLLLSAGISGVCSAQGRVIVAGEESAGVYVNITETAGALNVNVTGAVAPVTAVTFTTTTPTVTSTSGTLLAANTARKNVMIQNNHATATIYLNFTTTATTAHLAIAAGQSFYMAGILPTSAIRAVGSVASNTTVVVIEGQ